VASAEYNRYLWAEKRKQVLERAGWRCETCNRSWNLQVHHRHYETLYHEDPAVDLQCLCSKCHLLVHVRNAMCRQCGKYITPDAVPGQYTSVPEVCEACKTTS
jgi:hypothetical protein